MPVYEYKGFDTAGKVVKGLREADGAKVLRALLRKDGIMATEVKESGGKGEVEGGTAQAKGGLLDKEIDLSFLQGVSADDIGVATRQLATLLQAGVTMVESLTALIEQTENRALKRILSRVKTEVNEGSSLADAFSKHKAFDHIYVNMVRAGESSGTLDVVLERLADFKEGQAKMRGEIMGALMYPLIMVFVGTINLAIMFTVVVPRITKIFEHAHVQLPLMTRILIGTSSFARDFWWLIIPTLVLGAFLTVRYLRTERGRARWDRVSLSLPVFGTVVRMIAVARFSRTLSTLLSSGVNLLTALDIVKNVVANDVLARTIEETRDAVREGEEIAAPLKRSKQFPPLVTHMIAIGEKSGQLEQMLHRVAVAYEQRVDSRLKGLMSLLAPLLILVMGGAVGFIVFSILTPILQMNTLVK